MRPYPVGATRSAATHHPSRQLACGGFFFLCTALNDPCPDVAPFAPRQSGLAHGLATTAANASDVTQAGALLHGAETTVWGDAGHQGVEKRPEHRDGGVEWRVAKRPGRRRLLAGSSAEAAAERRKASERAKVEHPFLYVKRHFGYAKVRYRGVAKNRQRIALLLGFSNLLIAGRYATG